MESIECSLVERSARLRRVGRVFCAGVGLTLLQAGAESASAQSLRSTRPSVGSAALGSLSGIQRLGNTRVSRDSAFASQGGYSAATLGLSSGGFIGRSSRGRGGYGRTSPSRARSALGGLGVSASRSGGSRSSFARPFDRGASLLTPPMGRQQVVSPTERLLQRASHSSSFNVSYDLRQARLERVGASRLDAILLAPDLLVRSSALTMPVWRSLLLTGAMGIPARRDSFPAPEGLDFDSPATAETAGPAILQSTVQAQRLASTHRHSIQEGWDWLRQESYHQGKAAFVSAEASDRSDPSSRTGQTVIHLLLGNTATAGRMLHKALRHDKKSAFTVDLDLTQALGESERWRELDVVTESHLLGTPDDPEAIAIRAYVLWYGGDRKEAMRVVRRIRVADPTSEFAGMESLMQKASSGAEVSLPQAVN